MVRNRNQGLDLSKTYVKILLKNHDVVKSNMSKEFSVKRNILY